MYRLAIEGEERLPTSGPCIFACNHQSEVSDACVYMTIHRRRPDLHMFGWQNLRGQRPMFDFLTNFGEKNLEQRYLGAYWGRGLSAGELLRARAVLQQGGAIMITVEGEWTWDGRLQYPLAPGAAWLALRTGAPVVPVVSIGGYDVQPRWDLDNMRPSGRITVRAGLPFQVGDAPIARFTPEAPHAANERIWTAMAALLPPHLAARAS